MSKKIRVGKIVRAHGMKGEVKILPYLINQDIFWDLSRFYRREGDQFVPLISESVRPAPGGGFLIKFQGISSREEAESFHDIEIWADLDEFPPLEEDEFYHYQLLGLEVRLEDGTVIGTVKGLMPVGPYDLLEVKPPKGKTFYLPMIDEIILEINLEEKYILVRPTEGLIEAQS